MSESVRSQSVHLAAAILVAAGLIYCLALASSDRPASAAPASTTATTQPGLAMAFPAMTYYDQSCANCHGPHGSFYGPTLGNDLTDDALIAKCSAMAKGPGNAPLEADDNLAVTAYHRALIRKMPFLSVTSVADGQWAGEATAGAKVTLAANGKSFVATLVDWNWTASLPADTSPADVVIEATVNGKTTRLHPAEAAYSDTTPLPPPDQRKH